ncbi:MAG: hypothetical protein DI546_05915 [Rhizobium sp.]|nr:MAG: hypothetical protein DI546_05915 [Rhizobium sp.]
MRQFFRTMLNYKAGFLGLSGAKLPLCLLESHDFIRYRHGAKALGIRRRAMSGLRKMRSVT